MLEFLNNFFFTRQFIPHGHCYLWKPGLVGLHVVSDSLIALAYYAIPVMLVYFVRKRRDVPFGWIFLMFGIFIVSCGTTHVMEVLTLWHPSYWLSGFIKAITAVASLGTAGLLVPLIPLALALPRPAQLEATNRALIQEVEERKRAEEALQTLNTQLEQRVNERTAALRLSNQELASEIAERKQVEEKLKARIRQQAVVAELGQKALTGIDLSFLMDEAVALVAGNLDVEYSKILELREDGNALLLRAGIGWQEGLVGHETVGTGTDSLSGYTILANTPVIVENLPTETRYSVPPLLHNHGVVSSMSVIIPGQEQPFGVFGIHTTRQRTFTENDVYFLQSVANVIATAIERKRVESALRESEQRFRATFDQAAVGIAHVAASGHWLRVNQKFCDIVGYTQAELLERKFQDITHPDDLEVDLEYFRQVLAGEIQTYSMEKRYIRKACPEASERYACYVWINLTVSLVRDSLGEPKYFISVIEDITERKRTESALRTSSERLRLAMEAAQMTSWDWNILTNQITWSDNHERLFGLNPGTFGETYEAFLSCVHPEDRGFIIRAMTRTIEERVAYEPEFRIVCPDGSIRWRAGKGQVFYDETGQPVRMIGIAMDITERKLTEDKIKASLQEKEVLLKEIHHRVKNNLQIISSLLNLQAEYLQDNQAIEMFKVSQNRIESMALIHEKLYQSKNLAKINFAEYIEDLVASLFYSYEVNPEAIALKINIDDILVTLDIAIPCGLIINELVLNSMKHAFPSGRAGEICILGTHSDQDSRFTLIVRDNGIGFPPDLDFRKTESLGLQLVTTLSNQLQANIEVDTKNGVECKITCFLAKR